MSTNYPGPQQPQQPVYGQQPGYAPAGYAPVQPDAPSAGFAILCFFVPIVGLILWLVWKDQTPLKAKSCGKGALIGVIVWFVLGFVIPIVAAAALSSVS